MPALLQAAGYKQYYGGNITKTVHSIITGSGFLPILTYKRILGNLNNKNIQVIWHGVFHKVRNRVHPLYMSASRSVDLNLVDNLAPFQIGLCKDINLSIPNLFFVCHVLFFLYNRLRFFFLLVTFLSPRCIFCYFSS